MLLLLNKAFWTSLALGLDLGAGFALWHFAVRDPATANALSAMALMVIAGPAIIATREAVAVVRERWAETFTYQTRADLFSGDVRRRRNATIELVLLALGALGNVAVIGHYAFGWAT